MNPLNAGKTPRFFTAGLRVGFGDGNRGNLSAVNSLSFAVPGTFVPFIAFITVPGSRHDSLYFILIIN